MLSKEELIKLLNEDPDERDLPENAITSKSLRTATGLKKTASRNRIQKMLTDGRIVVGGYYMIRSHMGARKTPYYIPAKPKKK